MLPLNWAKSSKLSHKLVDCRPCYTKTDLRKATQTGSSTIEPTAVLLEAWSGPEGSRKLWFLGFMTTAQVNKVNFP